MGQDHTIEITKTYTREIVAKVLHLSVITVDRMISAKVIRATKVGRRVLISAYDVDRILNPVSEKESDQKTQSISKCEAH